VLFWIKVSNKVCDLKCKWSFRIRLGCVSECLYNWNSSSVLGLWLFGHVCIISRFVCMSVYV